MKKVLVIDDDPVLVKMLETRLKANGFEVFVYQDAPKGFEKALEQKPDIIILDVMMPIINGYNFCRLLKTQHEHKHIPVILLTSRSSEDDKKIGEDVGANAYLTKPCDVDDLLNKMNELLNAT
jgi:DNA-binding response OmpR family regulator